MRVKVIQRHELVGWNGDFCWTTVSNSLDQSHNRYPKWNWWSNRNAKQILSCSCRHADCKRKTLVSILFNLLDKVNNCQYPVLYASYSQVATVVFPTQPPTPSTIACGLLLDLNLIREFFLGELRFSTPIKIDAWVVEWSYLYIIHCRIAVSRSTRYIHSFGA